MWNLSVFWGVSGHPDVEKFEIANPALCIRTNWPSYDLRSSADCEQSALRQALEALNSSHYLTHPLQIVSIFFSSIPI